MTYVVLFFSQIWWVVQSILIFHCYMLAMYAQGIAAIIEGDRVCGTTLHQASFTAYKKIRFDELMANEGDDINGVLLDGDDEDGLAS